MSDTTPTEGQETAYSDKIQIVVDLVELRRVLNGMPYSGLMRHVVNEGAGLIDWLTKFSEVLSRQAVNANRADEELARLYKQRDAIREFFGTEKEIP